MLDPQPFKTYRGTWNEVLDHQNEIPVTSIVELKVFISDENQGQGDFGGQSVAQTFGHLFGTVKNGPSDMSEHPEKYLNGFGETKNPRLLKP